MLTRKFPKPGDRTKEIEITQPGIPRGAVAAIRVPEIERRQEHIAEVDPNHTLLQVTRDCLKDRAVERPSAQQLCERLAALKEGQEYRESVRADHDREQSEREEREREMRSMRQQHAEVVRQKDLVIATGQQQNEQLRREKDQVSRQLEDSEQVVAQLQRRIDELEQLRLGTNTASATGHQRSTYGIKMTWREGRKAPFSGKSSLNAVSDSTTVYIRTPDLSIYAYTAMTSTWSRLPVSPTSDCPSVIINGLLTLVGGYHSGYVTNQLFSLTSEGGGRRWTEVFPHMPTKRRGSTALCTGTSLIVVGGMTDRGTIGAVEIMNSDTLQWSTAADLPEAVLYTPGAVYGDQVYILSLSSFSNSVYTCSVSALLQSCRSRSKADVWNRVAAPPVADTACVSIQGRLLTIGGIDSSFKRTAAVYMYDPTTDSWAVISHMATPRLNCYAAVLPNNQLMVVGGLTESGFTDSVEIATVE